jgi:hypothetical protein
MGSKSNDRFIYPEDMSITDKFLEKAAGPVLFASAVALAVASVPFSLLAKRSPTAGRIGDNLWSRAMSCAPDA